MVGDGGHGLGERGAGGGSVAHSPRPTVIAILADENLVCDDQVGHNGGIFRIDRGLDLDKQESEATHKLDTQRTLRIE